MKRSGSNKTNAMKLWGSTILVSVCTVVGLAMILAFFMIKGIIPESVVSPAAMIIVAAASMVSGRMQMKAGSTKILLRLSIVLGITLLMLLAGHEILEPGKPMSNLWISAGAAGGSLISILMGRPGKGRKRY